MKIWIIRIAIVVLVPLFILTSWVGIEVSQSCRSHHILISRTHTDDNAKTIIQDRGGVIWEGVPTFMYSEVIVNRPTMGDFEFVTTFSDGVERKTLGDCVTISDGYHHYVNIGKIEDAYVDKQISLFSEIRDVLSCAALR